MTPKSTLRLVIYKTIGALTVKSVESFAADYRIALSELVAANLNGDIDAGTQARRHKALLEEHATDTYPEGMYESGQFESRKDAADSLDDSDRERIGEWIAEQYKFVGQFARDTTAARLSDQRTDAENESAQSDILRRVDLWGASLESLGSEGRASGQKNVMVTWKYGDTIEHCPTCEMLSGQRHKVKWFTSKGYIPRKPGNEKLSCGGWKCECQLVDDSGEVVL